MFSRATSAARKQKKAPQTRVDARTFLNYDQKVAIARWIFEEKEVIFGKLSTNVTAAAKTKAWENIFQKAMAKGYPIRDVNYLRKVSKYHSKFYL